MTLLLDLATSGSLPSLSIDDFEPVSAQAAQVQPAAAQALAGETPARRLRSTAAADRNTLSGEVPAAAPRVAAPAAQVMPEPPELEFLRLFNGADLIGASEDPWGLLPRLPLARLAQLQLWLGEASPATISDPLSQLRIHAAMLRPHLAKYVGVSDEVANHPVLAAGLGEFYSTAQLPMPLSDFKLKSVELRSELLDGIKYNLGTSRTGRSRMAVINLTCP